MDKPTKTKTDHAFDIEFVFEGPPILTTEAAATFAQIIRQYVEDRDLLQQGEESPDR